MAIYHMSAQIIGRSAGRSAVAAAAYRSGEEIADLRTGAVHDYTRKQHVDFQEILTPEHAGEWAKNRAELWNKAEEAETRKNSQVAREINIAIPVEISAADGRELVLDYAQKNFVSQGMIADICIHGENTNNPHAHIMLSLREASEHGFTEKNRSWNEKEQLEKWREEWAHCCNKSLEKSGEHARVDHRSLEAQGIDRIATIHQGPAATAIERREPGESTIVAMNDAIREQAKIAQEISEVENALKSLNSELSELMKQQEVKAVITPEMKNIFERNQQPIKNPFERHRTETQAIVSEAKAEPVKVNPFEATRQPVSNPFERNTQTRQASQIEQKTEAKQQTAFDRLAAATTPEERKRVSEDIFLEKHGLKDKSSAELKTLLDNASTPQEQMNLRKAVDIQELREVQAEKAGQKQKIIEHLQSQRQGSNFAEKYQQREERQTEGLTQEEIQEQQKQAVLAKLRAERERGRGGMER